MILFAFHVLMIMGSLAICAWYVYTVATTFIDQQAHPNVQLFATEEQILRLPTLTFCQPNHPTRAPPPIDERPLQGCIWWIGPDVDPIPCTWELKEVPDDQDASALPFQCYQINTNLSDPFTSYNGGGAYYSIDVVFIADNTSLPGTQPIISLVTKQFGNLNVTSSDIRNARVAFNSGYLIVSLSKTIIRPLNGERQEIDSLFMSYQTFEQNPDFWADSLDLAPNQAVR